jgi:hypothetical protein
MKPTPTNLVCLLSEMNSSPGILVGSRWLITAGHVFPNLDEILERQIVVGQIAVNPPENRTYFSLDPFERNGNSGHYLLASSSSFVSPIDITLVRIRPNLNGLFPTYEEVPVLPVPVPESVVWAFGFPNSGDNKRMQGAASGTYVGSTGDFETCSFQFGLDSGFSGGPVITEGGYLIGVVLEGSSGINRCVSIKSIATRLNTLGFDLDETPTLKRSFGLS